MTIELRSVFVWVAAFLFFELPAKDIFGVWPWFSLSKTVQLGEAWWWPIALYVPLFMVILLGHFELGWKARWVVIMGALGACLVASHLFRRYLG